MFNQYTIFLPLLAMVLLSAIVLVWMYKTRVAEMKNQKINPQKIADHASSMTLLQSVAGPADNLINLFEAPVLFYVATLTMFITQTGGNILLSLAWIYVTLRYLHSYIHCTYNKVLHRYKVYLASTVVLWLMWVLIGIKLIGKIN
ncbi:MAG: hypothetical protein GXP13_05230 [Gammaproteobacteria bacterium]|nr:hypothetical protein [Gammaproteobacteria bacterium]